MSENCSALPHGSPAELDSELAALSVHVFRFARRLTARAADAEDIALEALARVGLRIGMLRDRRSIKAWAFAITRNVHRMECRRRLARPGYEVPLEDAREVPAENRWPFLGSGASLPDEAAIQAQAEAAAGRAIARLPAIYREVVVLRVLEERSTLEAARELGITPHAVKTRLCRARLQLRLALWAYL